mmetsp:Transcript_9709/g.16345  ORF Transcript_9709/g.16345 Transcript_9709/m.16345 type:complete len:92 (+) Transcript_9709:431-706(+)
MTQIKQFQIERIENEIDFVLENIDYIYEPDITINKYQHHRSILFLLILVDIFMEVLLLAYFMRNSEYILLQLGSIYKFVPLSTLRSALIYS